VVHSDRDDRLSVIATFCCRLCSAAFLSLAIHNQYIKGSGFIESLRERKRIRAAAERPPERRARVPWSKEG
jgi:hypothetical protein